MMIFFWLESRPESESSEEDPLNPGDWVDSLAASVLVNVVGTGVPLMVCVVVIVLTVGVLVVDGSSSLDALVVVVVGSAVVVLSSAVEVGSSVVVVGSSVVVVEVSSSSEVDVALGVDVGSSVDVEVGSSVSVVDASLFVSVADVSVGVGRASVMSDRPVSVTCAL